MGSTALVFPDTRAALVGLLDGTTHAGSPVRAVVWLPAARYGQLEGPFPILHVIQLSGTQGFIDRVDRLTLDAYAVGSAAVNTLESILATVTGEGVEAPNAYLDEVRPLSTPTEVFFESDTLNRATVTVEVTVRPL